MSRARGDPVFVTTRDNKHLDQKKHEVMQNTKLEEKNNKSICNLWYKTQISQIWAEITVKKASPDTWLSTWVSTMINLVDTYD